jgi:hypothetical protein
MDLSGDPTSGSVEAKRFANSKSQPYGTARAAGKGNKMKAKPVVVQIDRDREIPEEIEHKDIRLYGVDGLLNRRSVNHIQTLRRELERSFFVEAVAEGQLIVPAGANLPIEELMEQMIQQIETTKNDFVDGVDRDLMHITATPQFYGQLRNYLDRGVNNAAINTEAESIRRFHGVEIESSVYLPATAKAVIQVRGSVAQPVLPVPYAAEKIPLSDAWSVLLFFYYGVKAVTPDLIAYLQA